MITGKVSNDRATVPVTLRIPDRILSHIAQSITAKASAYWMDGFSFHPSMLTLDNILASKPLVGIQISSI